MKVFLAQASLHCRNTLPVRVSCYCVTQVILTWILLIPIKDLKQAKNRGGGFVCQEQLKKLLTSLVREGGHLNTSVESSPKPLVVQLSMSDSWVSRESGGTVKVVRALWLGHKLCAFWFLA